jgi:hypothetical protein
MGLWKELGRHLYEQRAVKYIFSLQAASVHHQHDKERVSEGKVNLKVLISK